MAATRRPLSRRFAVRFIGGAALALPLAVPEREAAAFRKWCKTDPVFTLDGYYGSIYLAARMSEWELNNSSGDILIEHPKDVATNKVWEDPNGYFGQGVATNFATTESLHKLDGAMDVILKCRIPARTNKMRIRMEWAPGPVEWDEQGNPKPNPVLESATGRANEWISLKSTLPYR